MTTEQKKKKILLAEDDRYIGRAYVDGLRRNGFDVVLVENGSEVVEKIKSEKPDLVLLDVLMPGKNGFEVLEAMRLDSSISDTPVIVITNLSHGSDIDKAKALGALDYLVKANYSMKEIVEKVTFHIASKS